MSQYIADSIMFGSLGLPVGVALGFLLGKWDTYNRVHNPHDRRPK